MAQTIKKLGHPWYIRALFHLRDLSNNAKEVSAFASITMNEVNVKLKYNIGKGHSTYAVFVSVKFGK